jgi:molybdopterin/thiamine biosynthesis adenylyltransferase
MREQYLVRQWEILPMEKLGQPIHIIGAGAIGSFTALTLAKLGFEDITVYDDDIVDDVNMSCQFFRISDIKKPKVVALQELIKDFTGVTIDIKNEKYTGGQLKGIVIMALDSMAARKLVWDNHKEVSVGTKLIIDSRMGSETILCYAMSPLEPKDIASYEKTLYSDENAEHERCTAKSTMYTVLAISGHIANIVKRFVCEQTYTRIAMCDMKASDWKCWQNQKT